MDIAWIGHAAFRLRGREAAVVLDPCPSSTGFRLNRPQADVVTISNPALQYAWKEGVAGDPLPLDAPGEYEVRNVLATGVATEGPAGPASNVAFVITIDDVIVAHLGDLRAEPSPGQLEELNRADVLLLPVGGQGHLDAKTATSVVALIDPKLVIPMLYTVGPETESLDGVDTFLRALGVTAPEPDENHVNVTRAGLGERTVVQLLVPRGE